MKFNTIYQGDNIELLRELENDSIDLTVTSPPYGTIRDYQGNSEFPFYDLVIQLERVTKPGGVVVWIVGDTI